MTKQDLSDLLVRVEGATGVSYELEERIALALEPDRLTHFRTPPRYTSSLDAALALVTRVLPGWYGVVSFGGTSGAQEAALSPPGKTPAVAVETSAATPSLALLAAMLKALKEDGSARNPPGYDGFAASASTLPVDEGLT